MTGRGTTVLCGSNHLENILEVWWRRHEMESKGRDTVWISCFSYQKWLCIQGVVGYSTEKLLIKCFTLQVQQQCHQFSLKSQCSLWCSNASRNQRAGLSSVLFLERWNGQQSWGLGGCVRGCGSTEVWIWLALGSGSRSRAHSCHGVSVLSPCALYLKAAWPSPRNAHVRPVCETGRREKA